MTMFVVAASAAARDRWRRTLRAAGVVVAGESASLAEAENLTGIDIILVAGAPLLETRPARETEAQAALVVLSDDAGAAVTLQEMDLAGWAVLPPDAGGEELRAAGVLTAAGLVVMPPRLVRADRGGIEDDDSAANEPLTAREREVLERLADGLSNREIAVALGISGHTAKFHVASVLAKLGAANRAEAVRQGIRRGLLSV